MRIPALFAAAVVALAGVARLAQAADATPAGRSVVMSRLDPDGDGTVSLAEASAAAEAKFAALDAGAKGALDADALTGIMSARQIASVDDDKDATVDKAEYLTFVAMRFRKADTDGDGTLDTAELSAEPGRELVALLAY